jgi:hypothetical protein
VIAKTIMPLAARAIHHIGFKIRPYRDGFGWAGSGSSDTFWLQLPERDIRGNFGGTGVSRQVIGATVNAGPCAGVPDLKSCKKL